MDEAARKGIFLTGLCPGPRRFTLGAEMIAPRRKREGPVSDPSRISASGSVLGVLASMFLSPGQFARSVSQGRFPARNSGEIAWETGT